MIVLLFCKAADGPHPLDGASELVLLHVDNQKHCLTVAGLLEPLYPGGFMSLSLWEGDSAPPGFCFEDDGRPKLEYFPDTWWAYL